MQNAIPPTPEDDDDTVLVGRGDEETVIVSREETVIVPREETVIVPREETVIVIRGAAVPDDEDTISISTQRGSQSSAPSPAPASEAALVSSEVPAAPPDPHADGDDTVIVVEEPVVPAVGISAADDEVTVRVERSDSQLPTVRVTRTGSSQVRPAMVPQRGRRRGELRPAPVPSGFGGVSLVASGAGRQRKRLRLIRQMCNRPESRAYLSLLDIHPHQWNPDGRVHRRGARARDGPRPGRRG